MGVGGTGPIRARSELGVPEFPSPQVKHWFDARIPLYYFGLSKLLDTHAVKKKSKAQRDFAFPTQAERYLE